MLLKTERLIVREFEANDAAAVFAFMRDPDAVYDTQRMAEAMRKIGIHIEGARHASDEPSRNEYYLAVVLRETDQLIGGVNLLIKDPLLREAEIGFHLNHDFKSHGYATEAADAVVDWALRQPGVARVSAAPPASGPYPRTPSPGSARKVAAQPVSRQSPPAGRESSSFTDAPPTSPATPHEQ